jgi:hypothetical protein
MEISSPTRRRNKAARAGAESTTGMAVDAGGDLLEYPKGYPVDYLKMSSRSEKVAEFLLIHL